MKRLEAFGLSIAASILAILSGNLIGLVIGIWALIVSNRRECGPRFGRTRHMTPSRTPATATGMQRMIGTAALVLCLAGIPITLLITPLLVSLGFSRSVLWMTTILSFSKSS